MKKTFYILLFVSLLFTSSFVSNASSFTFDDSSSKNVTTSATNGVFYGYSTDYITFATDLDPDAYYEMSMDLYYMLSSSVSGVKVNSARLLLGKYILSTAWSYTLPLGASFSQTIVVKGSDLMNATMKFDFAGYLTSSTAVTTNMTYDFDVSVTSLVKLSTEVSEEYESGYQAGYSDGESAGYGSGYSDGYATGESEGYESGYQAGVNSVDTQSYYDLGYASGWDAGYLTGWDDGYAVGYQDAMDRISSWGADTSDYPKLLNSNVNNTSDITFDVTIKSSIPTQYESFFSWKIDRNLNPNHTYMFEVEADPINISSSDEYAFIINKAPLYLDVGGISYLISNFESNYNDKFYVPGDRMSSAFAFVWRPYCAYMGDSMLNTHGRGSTNIVWKLYDCGPSGDTQNHIANQTDQLMNTDPDNTDAFNDSNESFNDTVNDAHSVEQSLTDNAFTNVGSATSEYFTQPSTNVLAGAAFYTACINGLYNNMGDFKYILFVGLMFIILRFIFRKVKGG